MRTYLAVLLFYLSTAVAVFGQVVGKIDFEGQGYGYQVRALSDSTFLLGIWDANPDTTMRLVKMGVDGSVRWSTRLLPSGNNSMVPTGIERFDSNNILIVSAGHSFSPIHTKYTLVNESTGSIVQATSVEVGSFNDQGWNIFRRDGSTYYVSTQPNHGGHKSGVYKVTFGDDGRATVHNPQYFDAFNIVAYCTFGLMGNGDVFSAVSMNRDSRYGVAFSIFDEDLRWKSMRGYVSLDSTFTNAVASSSMGLPGGQRLVVMGMRNEGIDLSKLNLMFLDGENAIVSSFYPSLRSGENWYLSSSALSPDGTVALICGNISLCGSSVGRGFILQYNTRTGRWFCYLGAERTSFFDIDWLNQREFVVSGSNNVGGKLYPTVAILPADWRSCEGVLIVPDLIDFPMVEIDVSRFRPSASTSRVRNNPPAQQGYSPKTTICAHVEFPDRLDNLIQGIGSTDISIARSADTVCAGTVVELRADLHPSWNVEWEPASLFAGQQGRRVVSAVFTASRWVRVRGTNHSGCPGPVDSVFVAVVAPPAPQSYDTTLCAGAALELRAPSGAEWRRWTTPWDQSSAATLSFIADSSVQIKLDYGTAYGCRGSASYRVTVNRLEAEIITSDQTLCVGDSVRLEAGVAQTYLWEPSEGLSSSTARVVVARPTRTTTYRLRATSLGCTVTDSVTVTVVSSEAFAGEDVQLCPGGSTTLVGSGGELVEWRRVGLPEVVSTERMLSVTPTGTERYELRTTRGGCEARDTVEVSVGDSLQVVATGAEGVCEGEVVELRVSGADEYDWYDSAGVLVHSGATKQEVALVSARYRVEGRRGDCRGATQVGYEVYPLPSVAVSILSGCVGDSVEVRASGGSSYRWSVSGEEVSRDSVYRPTGLQAGTYAVSLSVENEYGCSFDTLISYGVGGLLEVLAAGPAGVCEGEEIELRVSGAEEYDWYDSAGVLVHSGATKKEAALASTRYRVEGRRGDCRGTTEVGYEVYPLPSVSVSILSGCVGDPVELRAVGGELYRWSVAGEEVSRDSVYRPVALQPGTYTALLRVESGYGCSFDTVVSYEVRDLQEVRLRAGTVRVAPGDRTSIPLVMENGSTLVGSSAEVRVRYDRRLFSLDSVTGPPALKSKSVEDMEEALVLEWPFSATGGGRGELQGRAMMTHISSTPVEVDVSVSASCVSVVTEDGLFELSEICYPFSVRIFTPLELRVVSSSSGVQASIIGGLGEHWNIVATDAVGRVVSEAHRRRGEGEVLVVDLPLAGSGVYFLRVVSERGMAATAGVSIVR